MTDVSSWYEDKVFSVDWTTPNIETWAKHLAKWRDHKCDVLEIGSLEGRSAIAFLRLLPHSKITCVDTFGGEAEQQGLAAHQSIERRFDANLLEFKGRVEKIRSRSVPALDRLAAAGSLFDIIYIDGSHHGDDVLADTVLSWQVLRNGGAMIWDDYRWVHPKAVPSELPKPAVDAFLEIHADDLEVTEKGGQVIAIKRMRENPFPTSYSINAKMRFFSKLQSRV